MRTDSFKDYFRENHFHVHPKFGYMHIILNHDYYFPGQIVRGRVYVQLTKTIKTSQAVLKITCEEDTGVVQKTLKVQNSITKRQTFRDDASVKNKERKRSVILEIPVINILKAQSENPSDASSGRDKMKRPPSKHAMSEFVVKADQELDDWIEQKNSENPSDSSSRFIFRIIEPIFRIKNKELKPGLY